MFASFAPRIAALVLTATSFALAGCGGGGGSVPPQGPGYQPDAAFAQGGVQTIQLPSNFERLYAYAHHPDGSHVVGGSDTFEDGFYVSVLLPDGSIDTSFGTNGAFQIASPDWKLNKIVVDPATGKIILVGRLNDSLVFVRLNRDGSYDSTFGFLGAMAHPLGNGPPIVALKAAVLPDGRVTVLFRRAIGAFVMRITPTGLLDPTFAAGTGIAGIPVGANDLTNTMVDAGVDGVYVGGHHGSASGHYMWIRRLSANGAVDAGFGVGGMAKLMAASDYPRGPYAMLMHSSGVVQAFGARLPSGNGTTVPQGFRISKTGLIALGANPALQGPDINLPTANRFVAAYELADGRIQCVYPGYAAKPTVVVQLLADGTPDTDFGPNGRRTLPSPYDFAGGGWDAQGGLVLVGVDPSNPNDNQLVVARFLAD
ncbi:MAG: delta-60 repeat domain-containing protein [Planctomycetota bacterium]|nr:delta-60 repeat domain-containing protein [Planctomycetota bacterium]